MADFTASYVDHTELVPLVQYAIEQPCWVGKERALFIANESIGVIQPKNARVDGIFWPLRQVAPDHDPRYRIQTFTVTTNSLEPGAQSTHALNIGEKYAITNITTNIPARVRVYDTPTHRNNDISRAVGDEPGDGLVAEVITISSLLSCDFDPMAVGSQTPAFTGITVTNAASNQAGVVTVTIHAITFGLE